MEVHARYGDPRVIREKIESCGFDTWIASNDGDRVERLDEPTGYIYAVRPFHGGTGNMADPIPRQ
jgi:hypothetical protein